MTVSATHAHPTRSLSEWVGLIRELSKSGIVALVLISVFGGYLIGHPFETPLPWSRLALTLFGVLFLAAGSSALNQYQDRQMDAEMPRTAGRPLPSGRMSTTEVLAFVAVFLILGLAILATVSQALLGFGIAALISYNGLYTLWWKRHWAYAAIPGAIPGALPILMGHVAASQQTFTPAGIYLFFILFYWQMPHFWVLALKFENDYRQGGVPTLPVARGPIVTVGQIVAWCLAYVALALIAPLFLNTGWIYLGIALAVSGKVLFELTRFARAADPVQAWLKFFLWINFSLVLYIAAAAADLWSVHLPWLPGNR